MTTVIDHIGSHFAGEDSNTLAELEAMLAREPLDPKFEEYGNFIYLPDQAEMGEEYRGLTHCWGNFWNYSYGFAIWTDDPELIERLTRAIRANQQTPAYLQAKVTAAENDAKRAQATLAERHRRDGQRARMKIAEGRAALARIKGEK